MRPWQKQHFKAMYFYSKKNLWQTMDIWGGGVQDINLPKTRGLNQITIPSLELKGEFPFGARPIFRFEIMLVSGRASEKKHMAQPKRLRRRKLIANITPHVTFASPFFFNQPFFFLANLRFIVPYTRISPFKFAGVCSCNSLKVLHLFA